MVTNSRYEDALQMVEAVKPFSPDAQVVLDPNGPYPNGDYKRDDTLGQLVIPVPKDTELSTEGPFCLYGHVEGKKLAIPVLDKFAKPYTIFPDLNTVYIQNVGDFKATYQELKKKSDAGHPLYQNGIKFGTNIVARGDDANPVVVLLWSAHPYYERQELA